MSIQPIGRFTFVALTAVALTGFAIAPAQSYTLTKGSSTSGISNPLVDDGIATGAGTFGAAPAMGTSTAPIVRTTTAVGGQSYTYSFNHIDFPTGNPTNLATDAANTRSFNLETPASQGGASATFWGADSGSGSSRNLNAILFDFTASTTPVRNFGVTLLDFEGGDQGLVTPNQGGEPARAVAYDSSGSVVFDQLFSNPAGTFGDGAALPITFASDVADPALSYLMLVVGDDDKDGSGRTERWAFAGATFEALGNSAQASNNAAAVPTPALLPGLIGFAASLVRKRRLAKQHSA